MQMDRWLVIDPGADEIRVLIPDSQRRIFTDKPITLTMPGWSPPTVEVGPGEGLEEADLESPLIDHEFIPGGARGSCNRQIPTDLVGESRICSMPKASHRGRDD